MPAQDVVNAVVASTEKYLKLLTAQNGGQNRYSAAHIKQQGELYFDDARWMAYRCKLARYLSIRPDSSATFVSDAQPGTPIEIYLIDYNRKSGETKFAAKTALPEGDGSIDIDFRWLVRRCLDWYRGNGVAVAEVEAVSNLGIGQSGYEQAEGQSADQFQAVRTILTEGLSYVWGPPGTGKTTWVLAKAAAYCVRQDEKVLILASTNLAVDNALFAILKERVASTDVLRVGFPSEKFKEEYPECCEDRVFAQRIRELENEKKGLEQAQALHQRKQECEREIVDAEKRQAEVGNRATQLKLAEKQILNQSKEINAELHRHEEARKSSHEFLAIKTKELNGLAFDHLVNELQTVESDHAQSIARLAALDQQRETLGFWAGLTGRRRKHDESIAAEKRHLEAVEGTLASMRQRRRELEPRVVALKQALGELKTRFAVATKSSGEARRVASQLDAKLRETREEAEDLRQEQRAIAIKIDQLRDQLEMANDFGPAEKWEQERIKWQIRIQELQAELDRYKQDYESKKVLGMTLDAFIGLTMQRCLDVDRVFIDEAPYAPLAKVIPVLSLRKPIAMLGDHCQLPPVYEGDNADDAESYWGKPSIFIEDAFRLGNNFRALNKLDEPSTRLVKRVVLRKSYRFGHRLSQVLDKHVYKEIGLQGCGEYDTSIESVYSEPFEKSGRLKRQNNAEVDEIVRRVRAWWSWTSRAEGAAELTLAILTPYKNQQKLINIKLRQAFRREPEIIERVEVWSVHQSQGREWDTVFFSASDTGRLDGNSPWYADSRKLVGRAILNTAISRAKQHLRIFNDRAWWGQQQPNSILTELANNPEFH